jgi:hypothetical protein
MDLQGFNSLSEMHDAIVKEAFLPAIVAGIGRAALGTGKFMVKRPLASLGVGLTAMDVGSAGAKGAQRAAESASRNAISGGFRAGPTF